MQIITLTTDMGLSDYYVAALKGRIYSHAPEATVVDVSHEIRGFDSSHAAYIIQNAYSYFPQGTVHIIGVDSEVIINAQTGSYPAIMLYDGHYFVGNDNGIFSLILGENKPEGFWLIDDVLSSPTGFRYPILNIFAPVAVRLAKGEKADKIGSNQPTWNRTLGINATVDEHLIRATIMHVDHYGNLITNVDKTLFNRFGENIPFTIFLRNKEYHIDTISSGYGEVPYGEKAAIFNDRGWLEIGMNNGSSTSSGGNLSQLLGLKLGQIVRIEFTPRGSVQRLDALF